jgi:hypothetical protein
MVLFLTDGSVHGERELLAALRPSIGRSRIVAFGIGTAVNRHLINKLTAAGRGFAEFLFPGENITRPVDRTLRRLRHPVLTDIELQWQENGVEEALPEQCPDVYGDQPLVVMGRFPGDVPPALTVRGRLAGEAYHARLGPLQVHAHEGGVPLAALWARQRIEELMDQIWELPAKEPELRRQVIELAKQYSLASPFTSFLEVEYRSKAEREQARGSVAVEIPQYMPKGMASTEPAPLAPALASTAHPGQAMQSIACAGPHTLRKTPIKSAPGAAWRDMPRAAVRRLPWIIAPVVAILSFALAIGLWLQVECLHQEEYLRQHPIRQNPTLSSVDKPTEYLPRDCKPAPGAQTIVIRRKQLYKRILLEREGIPPVPLILIYETAKDAPAPFYIMENKVSNRLFGAFVKANPEALKSSNWEQGARDKAWHDLPAKEHQDFPVMNVTLPEAHKFAQWLGGEIPTARQWDLAAGRSDDGVGPFVGKIIELKPGKDIALAGKPMDVGTAIRDKAITGCHDMAANGREWTRTISGQIHGRPQSTVDFAKFNSNEMIYLRGKSYLDEAPYLFRDADIDTMKGGKASKDIGFRIVIELP